MVTRGPAAAFALVLLALGVGHAAWRMATPLDGPFRFGFLGQNAARYALAGRNYARDGFFAHGLAPDFTPGRADVARRHLYLHHPPLAPLVVGLSFEAFGASERAAQLPFYVLGLCVPVLVFLVGRMVMPPFGAGAAAFLCAVAPMTGFYGGHVDPQGPQVQAAILGLVLGWLKLRSATGAGRRARWFAVAFASLAIGLLTDWPICYAAALVVLADRIAGGATGGATNRRLWLLPLACVVFLALFCAWIVALGRSPAAELFGSADVRTAAALAGASGADLIAHARRWFDGFLALFTAPLLVLAVASFAPALARAAAPDRSVRLFRGAAVVLLGTGLIHVVLFPAGALVHDYWTFLLLPGIALLGGRAVEGARRLAAARFGEGFGTLTAAVLLCACAFAGDRTTARLYRERDEPIHAAVGAAVREQVRPAETAFTNLPYNPERSDRLYLPVFSWSADRLVRGGIDTEAELAHAIAEEGAFDLFLYAPPGAVPPIAEHLFATYEHREGFLPGGGRMFLFDLDAERRGR